MNQNKEIRAFNFEVRANNNEDHGNFIEGRAIVYDAPTDMGWYTEIIDNGALTDTDLKDVRFLINHNTDMIPLARSRNNNEHSTMQMTVVDGGGMDIRAEPVCPSCSGSMRINGKTWTRNTRQGTSDRSGRCSRCQRLHFPHTSRHRLKPAV